MALELRSRTGDRSLDGVQFMRQRNDAPMGTGAGVDRGLRRGQFRGIRQSQGELPGEVNEQRRDYLVGLSGPRCTR